MVNLLIYSSTILTILIAVALLWFILIPILTKKKDGTDMSEGRALIWITLLLLIGLIILMIVSMILVQPQNIDRPKDSSGIIRSSNVVVSPVIDEPVQSTTKSSNSVYYQFLPKEKIMKKLNLENLTEGKQIVDYFHRNDESIFLLSDGTAISIIGDQVSKEKTVPPIQKIRVLGNQYIGLSGGKLFVSKNLKDWTLDSTKPNNVIDFDVPTGQNNFLFVQTPSDNLILDVKKNNQIVTRDKSETTKFGSSVDKFVRIDNQGVWINGKNLVKNYKIADIDQKDHVYIVPSQTSEFTVKNIMTADDYAILELDGKNVLADRIFVGDQIIYQ